VAGWTRVVVVVARDQRELYDYFRWGFTSAPSVEVVLDRRFGERRDRPAPRPPVLERRRTERRQTPGGRAELRARGFLIVRRDPLAGVRDWGALH
jgi:hypothetical protein